MFELEFRSEISKVMLIATLLVSHLWNSMRTGFAFQRQLSRKLRFCCTYVLDVCCLDYQDNLTERNQMNEWNSNVQPTQTTVGVYPVFCICECLLSHARVKMAPGELEFGRVHEIRKIESSLCLHNWERLWPTPTISLFNITRANHGKLELVLGTIKREHCQL